MIRKLYFSAILMNTSDIDRRAGSNKLKSDVLVTCDVEACFEPCRTCHFQGVGVYMYMVCMKIPKGPVVLERLRVVPAE